ncbi:hypothetical protein ABBQ38_010932 [Trebouxia sp. C0009 RCD-2024]
MGSSSTDVTLSAVLHEVPRLWEMLERLDKRTLLCTSQELHRQTSKLVSSIKSVYGEYSKLKPSDIGWLVSCNWTHLRSLELTLDPAFVPELSNGSWPLLTSLSINKPNNWTYPRELPAKPDEHIFDGFKGKWPLLECLAITLGKLNTTHITALVHTEWTSLKTLKIEPLENSLPDLMRAHWPQLKDLSLGVGLSGGALEPLSACPWSTLERLELVRCHLDVRSMASLIQADLPQLKQLLLCQVSVAHTEVCFSQLAQGRWPLLAVLKLELIGNRSTGLLCDALPQGCELTHFMDHAHGLEQPNDILALTLGKWPCLQSLTFDNFPIWDEDVLVLVQAAWPELMSLTMIGCFESPNVITLCMSRWPELQSLCLGSFDDYIQDFRCCARGYPTLKFKIWDVMS